MNLANLIALGGGGLGRATSCLGLQPKLPSDARHIRDTHKVGTLEFRRPQPDAWSPVHAHLGPPSLATLLPCFRCLRLSSLEWCLTPLFLATTSSLSTKPVGSTVQLYPAFSCFLSLYCQKPNLSHVMSHWSSANGSAPSFMSYRKFASVDRPWFSSSLTFPKSCQTSPPQCVLLCALCMKEQ